MHHLNNIFLFLDIPNILGRYISNKGLDSSIHGLVLTSISHN